MNNVTLNPPEKACFMAMYGGNIIRGRPKDEDHKPKRMLVLSADRQKEADEILALARRISDQPFTIRMLVSHPELSKYRQSRAIFTARYLVREGKLVPVGRDQTPYDDNYVGLKPVVYRHMDCVLEHEKGFDPNKTDDYEGLRQARDWPAPALAKRLPIECIWPRVIGSASSAGSSARAS